jgi:hypothetical protein
VVRALLNVIYILFAGPNLPKATYGAGLVPTPDGTGVVLIGREFTIKDLYQLNCSPSSYWSLLSSLDFIQLQCMCLQTLLYSLCRLALLCLLYAVLPSPFSNGVSRF